MVRCSHGDCSWQSIAPSEQAGLEQYAEHIVDEHTQSVDAEIPEGMVQVKLEQEDEWITATPEDARKLHDALHGD